MTTQIERGFNVVTFGKPATKLEAHIIKVATAWSDGEGNQPLDTLEDVYAALQREKQLYCTDHPRVKVTSIMIVKSVHGPNHRKILIKSSEQLVASAVIDFLL